MPYSRLLSAVVVLAMLLAPRLTAQPTDAAAPLTRIAGVGLGIGWVANMLDGDFAATDDAACGRFESGDGSALLLSGLLEVPLSRMLLLSLRPEYHDRSGTMRFPCVDPASIRLPDGTTTEALTEHVAEISHTALAMHVMLGIQPLDRFPLWIHAGPYFSYSVDASYATHEEILQPAEAEFLSGGQVRPYGAGSIASNGLTFGLAGGMAYRLPLGGNFELIPQVDYTIPLDDELQTTGIRTRSFRATLNVVYSIFKPAPPEILAEEPQQPQMSARLVVGTNSLDGSSVGAMSDTLEFHLQRTVSTKLYPLLTYLFFDHGSTRIPDRYVRRTPDQVGEFSESSFGEASVLDTYYNVLDIIGQRLHDNPAARITVTGTQPDVPPNASTLRIATERAQVVADYLKSTWKISPDRIDIKVRREPESKSNEGSTDGQAENRRVEIASDTYAIIAPVVTADTTYSTIMPDVTLFPLVRSEAGISRWTIDVGFDGQVLKRFASDDGASRPGMLTWQPPSSLELWNDRNSAIEARLYARDSAGQERTIERRVALRHVLGRDRVTYGAGQYSLILFDFNSDMLRDEHLRILELINQRSGPSAHAVVRGYTDRIGEDAFNYKLSEQRATNVTGHLTANVAEVTGMPESAALYDNSLPEGRFYSRCVTIDIERR